MTGSTPRGRAFVDTFADERPPGTVVGSTTSDGVERHGTDVEKVMSIDHHALRMRPLLHSGWGRAQISYGPHARRDGLMFAALVLNGHNTSQSERLPEPLPNRMLRWLQGHGDRRFGLVRRFGQWLAHPRKSYMVRRIRWWRRMAKGRIEEFDENLAIGWSATGTPGRPGEEGNSFVMHAALGHNGELWARTDSRLLPVVRGVQNLPICYVVLLRERGAAYYAGSLPGAHGLGEIPHLRPVAIDAHADEPAVHAFVHQAALGQIGFRVDTRVYGVQVTDVDDFTTWYGTAHSADRLVGAGRLEATPGEIGGSWEVVQGEFVRAADGARASGPCDLAVLRPDAPSGLVHVLVEAPEAGDVGVVFRFDDGRNHSRVDIGPTRCRLVAIRDGLTVELVAQDVQMSAGQSVGLHLLDDGRTVTVAIDGEPLFGGPVDVEPSISGTGVGIHASGSTGCRFERFEAHPERIDFGGALALPAAWYVTGDHEVAGDGFEGEGGVDLDGRPLRGDRTWRREYGNGRIRTTGEGAARVDASIERPNPGNTAYTIDWDDPGFADISVDVTPPGTAHGQGQRARAGLIVWDDRKNFLTISMYLDDSYDGASIAIFSHLDGFEEIYDAVWSMVAQKIDYGVTHRLRVVFDGEHLLTLIDDEPVLYRALTDIYVDRRPMRIHRVGVAVNWEWGDDTGSTFSNFVAQGRSRT